MAPSLATPFVTGIEHRGPEPPANVDRTFEPAYAPALFVRCGLPLKRLRREQTTWRRSHGPLRLEIQVESGCEMPYGEDRALLVLLATMAWRQRSRRLELGSAYEILQNLGQSATGADYRRLGERFSRLLTCRIRTWSVAKDSSITSDRHFQIHELAELWCKRKNSGCDVSRFRNSIILSEEFCTEIQRSPVQIPMRLVRALLNAPGALDLSFLIAWRSHLVRPGRYVRVAISGRGGLQDQLSVKRYLQDRDFRRQVRTWLRHIKESWPECPAVLTQNAQDLLICHGPLVVTPWEQHSKETSAG
jgi:hypothetical protein